MAVLGQFAEYKKTSKRSWVKERQELAGLYSNIQTKIRTYGLAAWEPRDGLQLEDLEVRWSEFLGAEGARSRAINARIREWVGKPVMETVADRQDQRDVAEELRAGRRGVHRPAAKGRAGDRRAQGRVAGESNARRLASA